MLPKTLVEAQLFTDGIDRRFVGALSEHHLGWVARQDVEKEKHQRRNAPKHRDTV